MTNRTAPIDSRPRHSLRGCADVQTPAFLFDPDQMRTAARDLSERLCSIEPLLLFSMKSFAIGQGLQALAEVVDGFSVSSLFEARLAREIGGENSHVHYVSPGLRRDEIAELNRLCNRITVNSIGQLLQFGPHVGAASLGLRVNPGSSSKLDERYNPCRPHSKLGIAVTEIADLLDDDQTMFERASGLHFHTNCDSSDLRQLIDSIHRIEETLGQRLHRFKWLNIGGGYDLIEGDYLPELCNELKRVANTYSLQITIEPGACLVRSACCYVSTILDIVQSNGASIAILDLSVNHWPEVFEYQFEPNVLGHVDGGTCDYILAGCSCLAGDIFGEYSFAQKLSIGDRIMFLDAGAYSVVKAHMFNGINLPTLYALTRDGAPTLVRQFEYEHFLAHCGV
jgi:carboxynorspermidine decarboxylase